VGAIACIDRIGRKPLLIVGPIAMTFFLGSLALIFSSTPADPETKGQELESMQEKY